MLSCWLFSNIKIIHFPNKYLRLKILIWAFNVIMNSITRNFIILMLQKKDGRRLREIIAEISWFLVKTYGFSYG